MLKDGDVAWFVAEYENRFVGQCSVELDVVKNNERALKMYQSFGFEIAGTRENALRYSDGSYADEYLMIKKL